LGGTLISAKWVHPSPSRDTPSRRAYALPGPAVELPITVDFGVIRHFVLCVIREHPVSGSRRSTTSPTAARTNQQEIKFGRLPATTSRVAIDVRASRDRAGEGWGWLARKACREVHPEVEPGFRGLGQGCTRCADVPSRRTVEVSGKRLDTNLKEVRQP